MFSAQRFAQRKRQTKPQRQTRPRRPTYATMGLTRDIWIHDLSRDCLSVSRHREQSRYADQALTREMRFKRSCVECGTMFRPKQERYLTCSPACSYARTRSQTLKLYHSDPKNWSSNKKRTRIFERDGWRCRACGSRVRDDLRRNDPRRANVGHIIAKSAGGSYSDQNLATLCFDCNRRDGSTHKVPIQTHLELSF